MLRVYAVATLAVLSIALAAPVEASRYEVAHFFCKKAKCKDGERPYDSLLPDGKGNFFGVAGTDRNNAGSVAFELTRLGTKWNYHVIYSFCAQKGCRDGTGEGPLIIDTAGNLYGTNPGGGAYGEGNVFEISPNPTGGQWTLTSLYDFPANSAAGEAPDEALAYLGRETGQAYDGASPLFGIATLGGNNNAGAVFELQKANGRWKEKDLYRFCSLANCADGLLPSALSVTANGTLYGTAYYGGLYSFGTVFQLSQKNRHWKLKTLHDFCGSQNCADGQYPAGRLLVTSGGKLIGATSTVLYQIDPAEKHWPETILYKFCSQPNCADGGGPSPVVMDASGNIFGATCCGGANGTGTLYRLSGSDFKLLYTFCSFQCADGEGPSAAPVLDADGNLLGPTQMGGNNYGNAGIIYELKR